jgi:hypothetical protein
MNSALTIVQKIKQQYQTIRLAEIFLMATAAGAFTASLLMLQSFSPNQVLWCSLVVGIVSGTIRFFFLGLHKLSTHSIVRYLNDHYPQLQDSADLLLRKEKPLSLLEAIQREQTKTQLLQLADSIKLPNRLLFGAVFLIISGVTLTTIYAFHEPAITHTPTELERLMQHSHTTLLNEPVHLRDCQVRVTPPAYTQLPPVTVQERNIHAPEGSTIAWTLHFDGGYPEAYIITGTQDSIALTHQREQYTASMKLTAPGFYRIIWKDSVWISSDYYKLDMIPDREPTISIDNLPPYLETDHTQKMPLNLEATLGDDYGLQQAYIIATVSKGSGESVKFREEKLNFDSPTVINGKKQKATRKLDLLAMGMEPGDELYYYIEAFDTKTPQRNKARTETYFISLRDTAEVYASDDMGLGVDLMPEYFRSQRQIIIDTEKLLANKKSLTRQQFNFTSNELGYDQKVLRLRYGQFMGEEFESEIAPAEEAEEHEHDEEEEDVAKKFGHAHDTNNEHNLVEEKKPEPGHDHEHKPGEKEDPLEAFVHKHDDSETATFFIQSMKTKLKAALTQMWDAELYLRLYEPEKSLPYQYKALQLLKEISNDSRIYVHRTGFDPPPIKEEKRLTGDLKEVSDSRYGYQASRVEMYPSIRQALTRIERLLDTRASTLTAGDRALLQAAGNELSAAALEQPTQYLTSLSLLRTLIDQKTESNELTQALLLLRRTFWKLVPLEATRASAKANTTLPITDQFIQQLQESQKR